MIFNSTPAEASRMADGQRLYVRYRGRWLYHAQAPSVEFAARWVEDRVSVPVWNVAPERWEAKRSRERRAA